MGSGASELGSGEAWTPPSSFFLFEREEDMFRAQAPERSVQAMLVKRLNQAAQMPVRGSAVSCLHLGVLSCSLIYKLVPI